jgi:uncharacterized protein
LPDLSWYTIALLALGTFSVSLLVAAFGPTGGLQLAIVATTLPPPLVIPVHAWISSTSAIFRAIHLRSYIEWRYFAVFAPVTLASAFIGVSATARLAPRILEIVVGLAIVASARRVAGPEAGEPSTRTLLSSPGVSALVTGFLTVFIGATGPLLYALMAPRFNDRQALMATHSVCLSLQHLSKIALFGAIGVTLLEYPVLLLAIAAASLSGTVLGTRLLVRTDEQAFRRASSMLLALSGCFVIVRALLAP